MDKLWMQVVRINRTEGYRYEDGDKFPTDYTIEERGKLYRDCLKEYGRCIGKIHVDTKERTLTIGWVFSRKEQYTDNKKKFLSETWISLFTKNDTVIENFCELK